MVFALGEPATRFIVNHRDTIAPDAKIVFGGFGRDTALKLNLPVDVVGAFSEFDIGETLELARALQPDAKNLFVIGGSTAFDREWLDSARTILAAAAKDYDTTYLEGLAIDEFVERASRVPANSIVLFLTIFADSTGRNFLPKDAVELIAAKASAPVYGPYDTYIGHGVVGGKTVTFESMGDAVAGLTLDALGGKTGRECRSAANILCRRPATEALGSVGKRASCRNRVELQATDHLGRILAGNSRRLRSCRAAGHDHHRAAG